MDAETKAIALGYASLNRDGKLRVLASAGRNLANSAKGVSFDYREMLQMANERLLAISDLQGRLAGMMLQLVEDDSAREPDAAFLSRLFQRASEVGIDDEMLWALSHAMEEMQVLH